MATKPLLESCTNIRYWEEWINCIKIHQDPQEPNSSRGTFKSTNKLEHTDSKYMRLYIHRHLMNKLIYGQTEYNCFLSNAFKWNLGYNLKLFLAEMWFVTGKENVQHVIRPGIVIPASHFKARYIRPSIIICRYWYIPR